jgi:hypothetical protein
MVTATLSAAATVRRSVCAGRSSVARARHATGVGRAVARSVADSTGHAKSLGHVASVDARDGLLALAVRYIAGAQRSAPVVVAGSAGLAHRRWSTLTATFPAVVRWSWVRSLVGPARLPATDGVPGSRLRLSARQNPCIGGASC